MALSCGSRVAKCILFVFNVIFWLAGACLLGVGIWFLVDKNATNYLDVATTDGGKDDIKGAAVVLVIVGLVIFITGGFGCLGAIKESGCMLTTYAILLCILLVLQIIAGVMSVVFKNDILDGMEKSMNKTVAKKFGQDGDEGITDSWKFMQVNLKCCGSTGPADWADSDWKKNETITDNVPETCCVLKNDDYKDPKPEDSKKCQEEAKSSSPDKAYIHTEGCHEALQDWVKDHAGALIGVAFGLLFIQVIGIILACCLKRSIASEYNTV